MVMTAQEVWDLDQIISNHCRNISEEMARKLQDELERAIPFYKSLTPDVQQLIANTVLRSFVIDFELHFFGENLTRRGC